MNKRVQALLEFMELDFHKLDEKYMKDLYIRIFDFSVRYAFAEGLDIYVDIKHFIEDGVRRIKKGEETWYKQDFINARLLGNQKVAKW